MYKRIMRLGGGHFGEVWLELDLGLGRLCAAKYLNGPGSASLLDPFGEARTMLRAENDHVVTVYAAEIEASVPVIRMEYLESGSVADLHKGKSVPVLEATRIIEDACRGLESLHAADMLHRDLKPANLMIASDGKVKVSDFGLACMSDEAAMAPIGYFPHLPPEALPSPGYIESVAGDIYGMGVTLYRLLNGDAFLDAAKGISIDRVRELIVGGKLPPRNLFELYVHERLRRVVRKAVNIDPSKRFGSAIDFRHAIERVRPMVSWTSAPAPGAAWDGVSADGSASWRAHIAPVQGGSCFRLERKLGDRAFRSITAASGGPFERNTDAQKHASIVLQHLATTGRPPGT